MFVLLEGNRGIVSLGGNRGISPTVREGSVAF
jgi:hypothetical protein